MATEGNCLILTETCAGPMRIAGRARRQRQDLVSGLGTCVCRRPGVDVASTIQPMSRRPPCLPAEKSLWRTSAVALIYADPRWLLRSRARYAVVVGIAGPNTRPFCRSVSGGGYHHRAWACFRQGIAARRSRIHALDTPVPSTAACHRPRFDARGGGRVRQCFSD